MALAWLLTLAVLGYFAFGFVKRGDNSSFRKVLGAYILWTFANLVLLVAAKGDRSDFWPFDTFEYINDYDFSEFLVYVGGPIVYIFARRFFVEESK